MVVLMLRLRNMFKLSVLRFSRAKSSCDLQTDKKISKGYFEGQNYPGPFSSFKMASLIGILPKENCEKAPVSQSFPTDC